MDPKDSQSYQHLLVLCNTKVLIYQCVLTARPNRRSFQLHEKFERCSSRHWQINFSNLVRKFCFEKRLAFFMILLGSNWSSSFSNSLMARAKDSTDFSWKKIPVSPRMTVSSAPPFP